MLLKICSYIQKSGGNMERKETRKQLIHATKLTNLKCIMLNKPDTKDKIIVTGNRFVVSREWRKD